MILAGTAGSEALLCPTKTAPLAGNIVRSNGICRCSLGKPGVYRSRKYQSGKHFAQYSCTILPNRARRKLPGFAAKRATKVEESGQGMDSIALRRSF